MGGDPDRDDFSSAMRAFVVAGLNKHNNVTEVNEVSQRVLRIRRSRGPEILLFISGKYIFSRADLYEIRSENPGINVIVDAHPHGDITPDARTHATEVDCTVVMWRELYGLLNRASFP